MLRLPRAGSILGALAASAICWAAAASCSPRPSGDAAARLDGVRFHGCDEVRRDGRCELRPGSAAITIWVPDAPGATTTVTLSGAAAQRGGVPVLRGRRFVQKIERLPAALVVRRTGPDRAVPAEEWTLSVVAGPARPAALEESEDLRASGEFARSRALLESLASDSEVATRADALGGLARIAVAEGRYDDAAALFGQSIALRREAGAVTSEIADRYALAYVANNLGDYAGVRAILAPIAEIASLDPTEAAMAAYYEGLAALGTSDHRRAVRLFQSVVDETERLDVRDVWASSAEMQIATLSALGRRTEAMALLKVLRARIPDGPVCARADALDLAGRLTAELDESDKEARGLLEAAAALYRTRCKKPRRQAYNLALLGMIAVHDGEIARAGSLLAASRAAHASPRVALQLAQRELAAAAALRAGRTRDAEREFRRLELTASLHDNPEAEWRALVGRAEALEDDGRLQDAAAACATAEDVLDRLHLQAPIGGGHASFLRQHEKSASRLVDLLLRLGRVEEAARAAHRSRARALSALAWPLALDGATDEARSRWYSALSAYHRHRQEERPAEQEVWGLSGDKLEAYDARRRVAGEAARRLLDEALAGLGPPVTGTAGPRAVAEGELFLSYHPAKDGWVGFAHQAGGVIARRLGPIDVEAPPERLAHDLLGPFARQLEQARRLELAPSGALNGVDIHALPWRGRPLAATWPVVYRVEAGRAAPTDAGSGRDALIVDPSGRLRLARHEASIAAAALTARGWTVRRLGSPAATHSSIEAALGARPAWFHYSGHARYAGIDGWESHLGDHDEPLLTVGDIVALPRGPERVVLAGCETAAPGTTGAGPSGPGLAHAFVLAGARWVVATTRPVRDADAHAVVRELYARLDGIDADDAAAALREAQLAVRDAEPGRDWASFRVFAP
jgi:tetratricopeptide (TPR) repeat protein